MPFAVRRQIVFVLVGVAVLATRARVSAAAEEDADAQQPGTMEREIVGFEVTPLSISLPGQAENNRSGHVDRVQVGPGGSIRLFRRRWQYTYVNPVQAGLYVSSGNGTIFAHLGIEGGVIVPGTARRIELGVGAGIGALAMHYTTDCDGACILGGAPWMFSFVARVLVVDRPTFTVGAGIRLVVPLQTPDELFGSYVGGGNMVLTALEVGFGRG